jgi:hypothetical protein
LSVLRSVWVYLWLDGGVDVVVDVDHGKLDEVRG